MSLLPAEHAQYSAIIDEILSNADLQTISAKQIRKGLQARLDVDIAEKKTQVQALIMERFDAASNSPSAQLPPSSAPETNGHSSPVKREHEVKAKFETPQTTTLESDVGSDAAPPKKKRKQARSGDDDAKYAAMLQAQENSRARPTRGGADKKRLVKKAKKPKKKSADKIKKDEDSDLELNSDGEIKEKPKKGGFHKQYHLSAPLADLVGEPTVVKKIWEYIKARDLQDPADKRQIRCDEKMISVFKQDRVHMFTMNKILSKQLYDVEEQ